MFLQAARVAAVALGLLALGQGIAFSFDGVPQSRLTYVAVYAVAALCFIAAAGLRLMIHGRAQKEPSGEDTRKRPEVEDAIDEGHALIPDLFTDPTWPEIIAWRDRTATKLNRTEARRFRNADMGASSYREGVQQRIAYLESLLDEPGEDRAAPAPLNPPRLSFGRAIIPREPQRIELPGFGEYRYLVDGRVVRVPVTNAQGAGEARNVHALLLFRPEEIHRGQWEPEHPIQGEWFNEHGAAEIEINLPGNGRPRLLDVALVTEGGYPHCYEWTTHSRAARLSEAHVVKANPVRIQIEVMGAAPTPRIENTLIVDVGEGMLRADWEQRSVDESTNWAPRSSRGAGFRTEPRV